MEETCRIEVGFDRIYEGGCWDCYVSVHQMNEDLERGKRWRSGKFSFSYDYKNHKTDPFRLFIELAGSTANVLLRLGAEEGDCKSYDMFSLFKLGKKELLAGEYLTAGCYKKSLFSDDFENFRGFYPFGFTLIQPSCPTIGHPFSSFFNGFAVHKPRPPENTLLSLSFNDLVFQTAKIYKDIVLREVLWQCELRPGHNRKAPG